ncbi:MAG: hypothetical protein IJ281_08955 [Clostridia bacterium]|nr:hypothetical protein [Clostridia bacterium]
MITVTYGITEEKYTLGQQTRISYGIAAYFNSETDGTATIIASVQDISEDREKLSRLVQTCNCLKLSVIHLRDVIEDFLGE